MCNPPLLAKSEQEWLPVLSEGCSPAYTMDTPSAGLLCDLGWKRHIYENSETLPASADAEEVSEEAWQFACEGEALRAVC